MTDIYDRATEREEQDRALAIAAALQSAPPLPYVGHCYNCAEPLPEPLRYCDGACRDDHATRQRAEAQRA